MILGINTSHGAGVCLLDLEGNIIFCVSEERLSRNKNEPGLPHQSIKYVLDKFSAEDIKYVVFGSTYFGMTESQIEKYYLTNYEEITKILRNPFSYFDFFIWPLFSSKKVFSESAKRQMLCKILKKKGINVSAENVFLVDHHLAHAASAYFTGDYENPAIVTIDAWGDDKSGSVNLINHQTIELKQAIDGAGSVGALYFFVTAALGLIAGGRHEGKVTGLAAYGNPDVLAEKVGKYIEIKKVDKNGNITFENNIIKETKKAWLKNIIPWCWEYIRWLFRNESYEELTKRINWLINKATFKALFGKGYSKEDIAAAAQKVLEDKVCEFAKYYLDEYNNKQLVLAGGIFANVKLNQRLFNLPGVENIFVHPGMGDEGLALGAAYQVLSQINPGFQRKPIKDVYLGPAYSGEEIEETLKKHNLKYKKIEDSAQMARSAAQALSKEKIIGLFCGRMEYGPRALGARSVLADPRKKGMHDILNQRMKRSEFMPFAPVIPFERACEILDGKIKGSEHTAEFMTITYDVKKEWHEKIPAVVHIDGTARPQLIKRETNPLYYDIVTEFGKITAVPIIINTSFNMHEEPIVCTPDDAVRSYLQGCVDIMVMENFWVER